MERSTFLNPWRILLSLVPLCYAAVLLIELQNTVMWLGGLAVLLVLLLVLATSLDYPLLVCWPAISSGLLLATCGIVLYQGVPAASAFPITHSSLELWVIGFLAGFAMIWVVIRTRMMNDKI
jgi:hypothetical protein